MRKSQMVVLSIIYLMLMSCILVIGFKYFSKEFKKDMAEFESGLEAGMSQSIGDKVEDFDVEIYLANDSNFYIDGEKIERSELTNEVTSYYDDISNPSILIRVSPDANAGALSFAKDEFKAQGLSYEIR